MDVGLVEGGRHLPGLLRLDFLQVLALNLEYDLQEYLLKFLGAAFPLLPLPGLFFHGLLLLLGLDFPDHG